MSRIFGPIRQIAYVKPDLDAAMRNLSDQFGIGPWFVGRDVKSRGCIYRGRPIELTMSVAFANSGSMQIEIIQQTSAQPSMFTEWLEKDTVGASIHHVSSWPQDYETVQTTALSKGFSLLQQGKSDNGSYAFFYHSADPAIIFEIAELTSRRNSIYQQIAEAAQEWDGSNPIRTGWPEPSE